MKEQIPDEKLNDIINGDLEAVINPVRAHVQAALLEEQKRDHI